MLHSKIYYMELLNSKAAAFIGSNNLTTFALTGQNGEAAVLLEGDTDLPEFKAIRLHIGEAQRQAVAYSPALKEAYAWWSREYFDGLKSEISLPQSWSIVRTILIFTSAPRNNYPKRGEQLYF
jgi:hypothetical protein